MSAVGRDAESLLRVSEAVALAGISKRTIARKVKDGSFPVPIYVLGHRRWRRAEVVAWVAVQAAAPRRRIEDNLTTEARE